MVGVPGKSKGCNTCRKRKIRCGLQRPECAQCIKSNRPCTGYHRETIFKHSGLDEQTASVSNRSTSVAAKSPESGDANGKETADKAASGTASQKPCRGGKALALPKAVNPRNVQRAQILSIFIDAFLPDAEKSHLGNRRPISWLQVVPSVHEHGDALSTALTAVSLARIGRLGRDTRLSMEAKVIYGTALTQLQRALSNKNLMFRDDTLGACLALEMYELLECSSERIDGWLIHAGGTAQLVRARGPNLHRSPLSHQLFLGFRTGAIIRACAARKSTYLMESEWRSLPWKDTNKSIDDELLDLMAQLPALFEQADEVRTMFDPLEMLAARLALVDRCWETVRQLKDWYQLAHAQTPSPQCWPEFATLHTSVDDEESNLGKVFPTALHYPNLRIAARYLHYWTSLMLAYGTIKALYLSLRGDRCESLAPNLPADHRCVRCVTISGLDRCQCGPEANMIPFDVDTLPPPPDQEEFHGYAHKVAQSVEYCLRQDNGHLGPIVIIFPLRVATQCFRYQPDTRLLRWCLAAMEAITTMKHMPFSQRICATEWGYRPAYKCDVVSRPKTVPDHPSWSS